MSRKERRAERKAAKEAKQQEKSIRLKENIIETANTPRIAVLPDIDKQPQTALSIQDLDVPKQPKANYSGSRHGHMMTWCARISDQDGEWSWSESRDWTGKEWSNEIMKPLNSMEGQEWLELQNMSSDTGHLMHHDHEVADLCREAQDRWIELNYEEFDTVFRFRTGNLKRAWGIEQMGHFYLIWYERNHNIYPTD